MTIESGRSDDQHDDIQGTNETTLSKPLVLSDRERATLILKHMFKRRFSGRPTGKGIEIYEPVPTDIIVSTVVKSGTTLTQYMGYLISLESDKCKVKNRTFNDINEVAPWLDLHIEMKTPLPNSIEYDPRIFKSHATREKFVNLKKTNQKHLIVIRNPKYIGSSFLDYVFNAWTDDYEQVADLIDNNVRCELVHLFNECHLLNKIVPYDEQHNILWVNCDWFKHTKSWLLPNQYENTLVLFFEDVVMDMDATIKRIASFAKINLDEEQVAKIKHLCSKEEMSNDPRFQSKVGSRYFGYDGTKLNRVQSEKLSSFKNYALNDSIIDGIERRFESEFGVHSYEQFKTEINEKQKQLYGL